jgi:hypothetical protein
VPKLPNPAVGTDFLDAFRTMVGRIEASIRASGNRKLELPVRMYLAGGVASHFYTARRITDDVDATFSHRMLLPEDLEISYRDTDGKARLLYFDRQYNDTFGLLHEDAYKDSTPLKLGGIDPKVVESGCCRRSISRFPSSPGSLSMTRRTSRRLPWKDC